MIELEDVSSWYGDVIALNGVTARIDTPLVGLLGPNGAGKSTLLSLITGLRKPARGRVLVDGVPPYDQPTVLRRIGLVPEPLDAPPWLTGARFVTDLARMSGMGSATARRRATDALRELGLAAHMHRPIRAYSQGMRQRVKLAQALVHKPDLLLLDEPFTGLDPLGRKRMMETIRRVAADGTQVVFSSHVLSEVEMVTKDVIMLISGRIVAQGTVRDVRATLSSVPLRIGVRTSDPRALGRALAEFEGIDSIRFEKDRVVVHVVEGSTFFRTFTERAPDLPVDGFGPLDEDLESVYAMLAERGLRR